ncbi:membrane-spanning 4-domains subfamily A member 15-like [Leptodactylus fuscus]|uniref:membrane-spanning 4-domains subfamily A member 15-like n=1 Tax=Leptodactylus fuscus TaxID=238119 RepID=UPI003F4E59C4
MLILSALGLCLNRCMSQSSATSESRHATTAYHAVFLRSQPRSRGFVQIAVAHVQMALGIVLSFIERDFASWETYIIFWGPSFLIFSGILAIAAHKHVSYKLIRVCNVFHTISVLIIVAAIIISGMDAIKLYSCGLRCGSVESMAVVTLIPFTNVLQLNASGYVVYYGCRSLHYVDEIPPQIHGNVNLGFVPPDPPAYSEAPFYGPPPPFPQPSEFPQSPQFPLPPPYPKVAPTDPPPEFSEVVDYSQPPPYSA